MSRWVAYSDDVNTLGTEPRGRIHYLDAERNEFPCGAEKAFRAWEPETAESAVEKGDATLCLACHNARQAQITATE
jgi:hypothetical protein